jgi:hypothetical protein
MTAEKAITVHRGLTLYIAVLTSLLTVFFGFFCYITNDMYQEYKGVKQMVIRHDTEIQLNSHDIVSIKQQIDRQ